MITLIVDAITALVKIVDRAFPEERATPATPYSAVEDAQPAGAGSHPPASATGTGGHPIRTTSELLNDAVRQLWWSYDGNAPAVISTLCSEMRLRAGEFAAIGD